MVLLTPAVTFETPLRIPTTAGIPSTNTVKVEFERLQRYVKVVTTVTHDVPEGAIRLSDTTSGSSGFQAVTIIGRRASKTFVPVSEREGGQH